MQLLLHTLNSYSIRRPVDYVEILPIDVVELGEPAILNDIHGAWIRLALYLQRRCISSNLPSRAWWIDSFPSHWNITCCSTSAMCVCTNWFYFYFAPLSQSGTGEQSIPKTQKVGTECQSMPLQLVWHNTP